MKCLFVLMFFIIMEGKNDIWLVGCLCTYCRQPSISPRSNATSSVCMSVCLGFPCKFLSWQEEKSVY